MLIITGARWMQTWPPNLVIPPGNTRGADNRAYVARILWSKPNTDWNQR